MQVVITQKRDKRAGIVNGQPATVVNCQNNKVILRLANGRVVFTHPVTTIADDGQRRTCFPFSPSYVMTICKSQGATIQKVILCMDCPYVPAGTGYVALSRVRCAADLDLVTRLTSEQLQDYREQDGDDSDEDSSQGDDEPNIWDTAAAGTSGESHTPTPTPTPLKKTPPPSTLASKKTTAKKPSKQKTKQKGKSSSTPATTSAASEEEHGSFGDPFNAI